MQKFTRQGALSEMNQPAKPSGDLLPPKALGNDFNNANMGRPLTGRESGSVAANAKRYGIFGNANVGDHFGRSGSPKGSSPKI